MLTVKILLYKDTQTKIKKSILKNTTDSLKALTHKESRSYQDQKIAQTHGSLHKVGK